MKNCYKTSFKLQLYLSKQYSIYLPDPSKQIYNFYIKIIKWEKYALPYDKIKILKRVITMKKIKEKFHKELNDENIKCYLPDDITLAKTDFILTILNTLTKGKVEKELDYINILKRKFKTKKDTEKDEGPKKKKKYDSDDDKGQPKEPKEKKRQPQNSEDSGDYYTNCIQNNV